MVNDIPPEERETLPPEPTPGWATDLGVQLDAVHTMMARLLSAVAMLTNKVEAQSELLTSMERRLAKTEAHIELERRRNHGVM